MFLGKAWHAGERQKARQHLPPSQFEESGHPRGAYLPQFIHVQRASLQSWDIWVCLQIRQCHIPKSAAPWTQTPSLEGPTRLDRLRGPHEASFPATVEGRSTPVRVATRLQPTYVALSVLRKGPWGIYWERFNTITIQTVTKLSSSSALRERQEQTLLELEMYEEELLWAPRQTSILTVRLKLVDCMKYDILGKVKSQLWLYRKIMFDTNSNII